MSAWHPRERLDHAHQLRRVEPAASCNSPPETIRPCGTTETWGPMRSDGFEKPERVPAVLYRHTHGLPASDLVGNFEVAAAAAGPGAITCACEGDCCREDPGSRRVDFTIAMAGDATKIPTLDSQEVAAGDLDLGRAYFPSACAEPAQYEWLFGRTTPAP